MPRKPKIITETVAFLKRVASELAGRKHAAEPADPLAGEALDMAAKLDAYDARETRKDPSKRKAKKAKR
jgi:hypothetical protein